MAQQPLVRLRLKKAGGEIGDEITVAALADLQDNPGETWGYDPNAFVYALVAPDKKDPPKRKPKLKKQLTIDSITVGRSKVALAKSVTTTLIDGMPVLPAKHIVFGERDRDRDVGGGRDWFTGHNCGSYLREHLERAGRDSEAELVKIAQRSVAPPRTKRCRTVFWLGATSLVALVAPWYITAAAEPGDTPSEKSVRLQSSAPCCPGAHRGKNIKEGLDLPQYA